MIVTNVTPTELDFTQDRLSLMGSKVSFRDLYNKQNQLPIYKGKYYKADDVVSLFVTINNILTTVSTNYHNQHEIVNNLRTELEQAKLENNSEVLKEELSKKDDELFNFIKSSNEQLAFIQGELDSKDQLIAKYEQERTVLAKAIRQYQSKIKELEENK